MIRPEARAALWRWREVLAGIGASALGLWWLARPASLLLLPGAAALVVGLGLIWLGWQRARFRGAGDGPGTLQVVEGQIAYFGPLSGGTIAVRDLSRISLDPSGHPAHWRLEGGAEGPIEIPVNADGVEALFDVFARLPGFSAARANGLRRAAEEHPVIVWRRTHDDPRLPRLD